MTFFSRFPAFRRFPFRFLVPSADAVQEMFFRPSEVFCRRGIGFSVAGSHAENCLHHLIRCFGKNFATISTCSTDGLKRQLLKSPTTRSTPWHSPSLRGAGGRSLVCARYRRGQTRSPRQPAVTYWIGGITERDGTNVHKRCLWMDSLKRRWVAVVPRFRLPDLKMRHPGVRLHQEAGN